MPSPHTLRAGPEGPKNPGSGPRGWTCPPRVSPSLSRGRPPLSRRNPSPASLPAAWAGQKPTAAAPGTHQVRGRAGRRGLGSDPVRVGVASERTHPHAGGGAGRRARRGRRDRQPQRRWEPECGCEAARRSYPTSVRDSPLPPPLPPRPPPQVPVPPGAVGEELVARGPEGTPLPPVPRAWDTFWGRRPRPALRLSASPAEGRVPRAAGLDWRPVGGGEPSPMTAAPCSPSLFLTPGPSRAPSLRPFQV